MEPPFEEVELFPVVQSPDGAVGTRNERRIGRQSPLAVLNWAAVAEGRPDVREDDAERDRAAR